MESRFKKTKIAGVLGIVGNLFLVIIKGIIGIISGSMAMMADAINSLADIFSSIMTYIGNKIASIPKDDDHNLGHGKAEYIYSLLISIIMILLSFNMIKNSFISLFNHSKYNISIWLVIVCIITIIVKFCLYLYTYRLYKKYNNILIKSNSMDHRNDCFVTMLTLLSIILGYFNIYFIDGIVGILISIWIFISGALIFRESYDVLMDKSIDNSTKEEVYKIIKSHKEIKRINHFNSTPVGYMYQISFSIFVDGNLSTFESHEIADKLEDEIVGSIDNIYLVIIHVNPM